MLFIYINELLKKKSDEINRYILILLYINHKTMYNKNDIKT